jgi:putative aldouronate transport system permease protein
MMNDGLVPTVKSGKAGIGSENPLYRVQRKSVWKRIWKSRMLYVMFLPCVVLLGIFNYFPMYGIVIAFKDFYILEGILGSPWVGLKHFLDIFENPDFLRVLSNTIIISVYRVAAGLPVPVIFALMLNEMRNGAYKRVAQSISYLPHFISWVVATGMITQILSPSSGFVNVVLKALGFEPVFFMAEPSMFRHILVLSGIWKEMGWASILYLAVLTQVDPEVTEAAIIDGASRLQRIWHINLHYVLPIVSINMILSMGQILNAGFEQIFNMVNMRVLKVADIIDTYVYRIGLLQFNYSVSAAVGVFKNVVGIVFVIMSQMFLSWMNRRLGDREIYGLY